MSPPSPPSRADPDALLCRYARGRGPGDRDEIFERYRPLAYRLARRYAHGGPLAEDLEQVACLGLLKAIERFDPARGFAFPSFAVPTILGELRRSFRATAWAAHVPRDLQERAIRVRREADAWVGRHGRTPTIGELAEAGGWVHEEVVDALAAAQTLAPASLDARITGHHDGDGPALLDRLGDDDPDLDLVERRDTIASALHGLSDIQREVIRLRFDEELTQSQIAARVGFSQMHVSRVLRAALERLNVVATHQSRVP